MDHNNKVKPEKSGYGKLIAFLILLIFLLGIGSIFYFNLGNVREKYVMPVLGKMGLFKDVVSTKVSKYDGVEREDLIKQIETLTENLNNKDIVIKNYETDTENKDKEIERLKKFEDNQLQFKQDKQEFDKMIVNNDNAPDVSEYIKYYGKLDPSNAEKLYQEALKEEVADKNTKKFASTYQEMDPANAATILEKLSVTDMELVIVILNNVDNEQRASILAEMEPRTAARITTRLAPNITN